MRVASQLENTNSSPRKSVGKALPNCRNNYNERETMNKIAKPVLVIRNPLRPNEYRSRSAGFLNLVLVGTRLDGDMIYAGCALSGHKATIGKVEGYLRNRFGMVID